MRTAHRCPICNSDVSHVKKKVFEGEPVLIYWHQETSRVSRYCIEHPNGVGETIELSDVQSVSRSA